MKVYLVLEYDQQDRSRVLVVQTNYLSALTRMQNETNRRNDKTYHLITKTLKGKING